MLQDDHPLLTKRMGGAVAVLGLTSGLGLALMSFGVFSVGMIIALLGGAGSLWIYWSDLKKLRLRLAGNSGVNVPLYPEIWVILGAMILAIGTPGFIYIRSLVPPSNSARHLRPEETSAIIKELSSATAPHFVYVFSASSCDECAEYSQDFRDAINQAPGWKAGGTTNMFGDVSERGLKIYTKSTQNAPEQTKKLAAALNAAHLHFDWIEDAHIIDAYEGALLVDRAPR